MAPIDSAFHWMAAELRRLRRQHLHRQRSVRRGATGPWIMWGERPLVSFASNDYLGLAADARLVAAALRAAESGGWGSGASPLISGYTEEHLRLEQELAEFEGAEACLLFPTGYAANVGVITSLADRQSVIFSDAQNHASIIDGSRLSGATIAIFSRRHLDQLQDQLVKYAAAERKLIVTDGLFSMEGDVAPLRQLQVLAAGHGAMLLVDEAHATGVLGAAGRGACESCGVESGGLVRVGTLSKALGSMGGFVVGPQLVIDWLVNRARSLIFSTAAPAAHCAAGRAALAVVREEPFRRQALLARASQLRQELVAQGWDIGHSTSQIVPLLIGGADRVLDLSAQLRDVGLWVPAIRPPSVPNEQSLLRVSLSYDHSDSMCEQLVGALGRLRRP